MRSLSQGRSPLTPSVCHPSSLLSPLRERRGEGERAKRLPEKEKEKEKEKEVRRRKEERREERRRGVQWRISL